MPSDNLYCPNNEEYNLYCPNNEEYNLYCPNNEEYNLYCRNNAEQPPPSFPRKRESILTLNTLKLMDPRFREDDGIVSIQGESNF